MGGIIEMRKEKIFGISIVTLLIITAVIPTVNATQMNSVEIVNKNNTNIGYDLEVKITKEPFLKSNLPVIQNGKTYSIYEVKYEIKNVGTSLYTGEPMTVVKPEDGDPEDVIDWWYEDHFTLLAEGKKSFNHEIWVETSENPDEDEERYFADHNVILECGVASGQDLNPLDNLDVKRVFNFWRNDDEFNPTMSQLLVCLPYRYTEDYVTINDMKVYYPILSKLHEKDNKLPGFLCKGRTMNQFINSKEFENLKNWAESQIWENWNDFWGLLEEFVEKFEDVMDFFWEEVPDELNNHRFGWTKNVTRYLTSIITDVTLFLLVGGSSIYTAVTSQGFVYIIGWIKKCINLFDGFLTGTITDALFESVFGISTIGQLITYATGVLTLLEICGGIELFLFAKAKYDFEQLLDWKSKQPWKDTIRVYGRVDYLKEGETVNVSCRDNNYREKIPENDRPDDNIIWYDFPASPAPMYKELGYKSPHRCVINAEGNKHKKELGTETIMSYCFSGGEIYKWFTGWENDGGSAKEKEITGIPSSHVFINGIFTKIRGKLIQEFSNIFVFIFLKNNKQRYIDSNNTLNRLYLGG